MASKRTPFICGMLVLSGIMYVALADIQTTAETAKLSCHCSTNDETVKSTTWQIVNQLIAKSFPVRPGMPQPCDTKANACEILLKSTDAKGTNISGYCLEAKSMSEKVYFKGCISLPSDDDASGNFEVSENTIAGEMKAYESVRLCKSDYCNRGALTQATGMAVVLLFASIALAFFNIQ